MAKLLMCPFASWQFSLWLHLTSHIYFLSFFFDFVPLHEVIWNVIGRSDTSFKVIIWSGPLIPQVVRYIPHSSWEAVKNWTGPLYKARGSSCSNFEASWTGPMGTVTLAEINRYLGISTPTFFLLLRLFPFSSQLIPHTSFISETSWHSWLMLGNPHLVV